MSALNMNPALARDGSASTEETSLPLAQLLANIVAQEGSFANLSEEELQERIAKGDEKVEQEDKEMESFEEEEQEAVKGSSGHVVDDFLQQKQKAIEMVESALNESSLSLDFVSLLISCQRPAAGSSSMSPHLKQHVKVGALSSSKIQDQSGSKRTADEEAARKRNTSAGRGWKLQSLEKVSGDLKAAAERLSVEVAKEKKYWDGMLGIVRSDEVIIPVKRKADKEIGVKYGFGDAGSSYYDKGIGLLLENKDSGDLYFEKMDIIPQMGNSGAQGVSTNKVVTVRVYQRESGENAELRLVGESSISRRLAELGADGESVLGDIERARFFLFEEELHHHLLKEASLLKGLQVKVDSGKILVEFQHMTLELGYEDAQEVLEKGKAAGTLDAFDRQADEVGCFIRLMLCSQHRHNMQRKRLPPVSLSHGVRGQGNSGRGVISGASQEQPQAQPQPQMTASNQASAGHAGAVMLIRPLITYRRHNRTISELIQVFESVMTEVEDKEADAVLKKGLRVSKFCNDPNRHCGTGKASSRGKLVKDNPFIRCLISPLSIIQFRYRDKLTIRVELSSSSSASYSTIAVRVTKHGNTGSSATGVDSSAQDSELNVVFNDVREVEDCLNWVIRNSK